MPSMYKSFCYETGDQVAQIVLSEVFTVNDILIDHVDWISGSNEIRVFDDSVELYRFNPPTCTNLGFSSSFTGLTPSDAVEVSGLALTAIAVAWGITVLRRVF